MKLYIFYLLIIIPLGLMVLIALFGHPVFFMILLLVYALLYRPLIHIKKLISMGAIKSKESWKLFIPFMELRYFKDLYLN